MKLQELLDKWKREAPIDKSDLQNEAVRLYAMHAEYLDLLSLEKMQLKVLKDDLAVLKLAKHQFLFGGATEETREKGWVYPTLGKIMKDDMSMYLNADGDIQKIEKRIAACETKIGALTTIMYALKDRASTINSLIRLEMFYAGA
jgi:hypothetical protein